MVDITLALVDKVYTKLQIRFRDQLNTNYFFISNLFINNLIKESKSLILLHEGNKKNQSQIPCI